MNAPAPTESQSPTPRLALEPQVLDEAFAELTDLGQRIDSPKEASASNADRDFAAESKKMIAQIGDQLQAIEQQRSRLVNLLESIEIPGS